MNDVDEMVRRTLTAEAARAPDAKHLAAVVSALVRKDRRRRALGASGAVAACVMAGTVLIVGVGSTGRDDAPLIQPGVQQAQDVTPLLSRECPTGYTNVANEPLYASPRPKETRTAEQLARHLGALLVLPQYPDAALYAGQQTATTQSFFYILPSGARIAQLTFAVDELGWRWTGSVECSRNAPTPVPGTR